MGMQPYKLEFGPSRTKQSFRNETDINQIMKRFAKTGMIDPANVSLRKAAFGDFSQMGDFHEMQEKIVKGREAFETLSSEVRERFRNDPGLLLDFLHDENNREEAVRLGLSPEVDKPPEDPDKEAAPAEAAPTPKPE